MRNESESDDHLSHIVTLWTVVFKAHEAQSATLTAAQAQLLSRYAGAIYRYAFAALRDPHAADDLAQDFALGMCKGLFKHANPEKGRFRDYVKTALVHLISKYRRRQQAQPYALDAGLGDPAAAVEESFADDEAFVSNWRQELMNRAWEDLKKVEQSTGQLFHTFLDFRTRNPDTSSEQMAKIFAQRLGKPYSAGAVRQTLHRARTRFAELLLDEVAHSLETRDKGRIEQELIDLGLYEYCKDVLKQWI